MFLQDFYFRVSERDHNQLCYKLHLYQNQAIHVFHTYRQKKYKHLMDNPDF